MSALQADPQGQVFLFGLLGRGQYRAHSWGVDGYGLFHENVLAGPDRGLEMDWPEAWRSGQDH
jgi:hypothetical protein